MRTAIPLLALAGLATLPAAADARLITYGSSLKATPTIVEAHQADTAFWPVSATGGRAIRAPATGQILAIRLKGTALERSPGRAPLNQVHFQHLVPQGHGRMLVVQTSGAFAVPIGGPRGTISTFRPENLCVRKGDVVDFNDEGGWDPPFYQDGAPFRVFAKVGGARVARYIANNATNNGATLEPTARSGEELLMALVLGTGRQQGTACQNFNRGTG
ncbi:MAG: hypothetical protein QOF12_2318 [Solirubrobacteraceae bacterium]|jgi:hypothetical protein|nr:hypothetical protein [Solirubrobacteraceae bacterium]